MDGRGDQTARSRQRGQLFADICRIERPFGDQRQAVLHSQQHGRFQAVHVLSRNSAQYGHATVRRDAETRSFRDGTFAQAAPRFGVCDRLPSGTRGEHQCRALFFRNDRDGSLRGIPYRQIRIMHGFYALEVRHAVGQAIHVGITPAQSLDETGGVVRR